MITNTLLDQALVARTTPADEEELELPVTANLVAHWRADAIEGLSDGDPVSTWPDSSANGYSATQGTPGARPLWKTNIKNGKPAVRFDSSDDGMVTDAVLGSPYTLFIVYCSAIDTSGGLARRTMQGRTNNWLVGPYIGKHKLYNGAFIEGPTVVAGEFVIACARKSSGGTTTFRVDGTDVGTNAAADNPSGLAFGYAGVYGEPAHGDILEAIAYSAELASGDLEAVEDYLTTKYAL